MKTVHDKNQKLLKLVQDALNDPQGFSDIDLNSEDGVIYFAYLGTYFRVTDLYWVEEKAKYDQIVGGGSHDKLRANLYLAEEKDKHGYKPHTAAAQILKSAICNYLHRNDLLANN
jgi:hypothetical protein